MGHQEKRRSVLKYPSKVLPPGTGKLTWIQIRPQAAALLSSSSYSSSFWSLLLSCEDSPKMRLHILHTCRASTRQSVAPVRCPYWAEKSALSYYCELSTCLACCQTIICSRFIRINGNDQRIRAPDCHTIFWNAGTTVPPREILRPPQTLHPKYSKIQRRWGFSYRGITSRL